MYVYSTHSNRVCYNTIVNVIRHWETNIRTDKTHIDDRVIDHFIIHGRVKHAE